MVFDNDELHDGKKRLYIIGQTTARDKAAGMVEVQLSIGFSALNRLILKKVIFCDFRRRSSSV